jgi:hypothetical protein
MSGILYAAPGASVEATVAGFPSGLAGTVRYRLLDNAGTTTSGPTTSGITEYPASSGFYAVTFTAPTTAGQYTILWDTGTLGPTTSAPETLIVSYSAATSAAPSGVDLCTVADIRTVLEIPSADTTRDTLIQDRITSASRMIQSYTEREFVAVASTTRRFIVPIGGIIIDLAPFDLRAATTVSLHPESASPTTLTANADYMLRPVQPRFSVYTHLGLSGRLHSAGSDVARYFGFSFLDITGTWGFASVPGEARDACIDCVVAWVRRDMSAMSFNGVLDTDPSQQGERPSSAFTLPYSARQKLDPFRRSLPAL